MEYEAMMYLRESQGEIINALTAELNSLDALIVPLVQALARKRQASAPLPPRLLTLWHIRPRSKQNQPDPAGLASSKARPGLSL